MALPASQILAEHRNSLKKSTADKLEEVVSLKTENFYLRNLVANSLLCLGMTLVPVPFIALTFGYIGLY